jgi:hypothetical protein
MVPATWVIVIVEEIPAMQIVDETIAIVVESIVGDFPRVCPCIGSEVWVRQVNSRVDDRDDLSRITGGDAPSVGGSDVSPLQSCQGAYLLACIQ